MAQTPADLDTSLALKLIPMVELKEDASNFEEWEHSVSFHLNYHRLDCSIDPIPRIPQIFPSATPNLFVFVCVACFRMPSSGTRPKWRFPA
ncbi:unnamed protein product [Sordaria macrospora k-hell]|uniref:WGS project CABT00000000 data, contig 2.26 n=1 Tax=Sordaria macrospora (strain ATCC MYA-333 / DSM 997 / K(L3346) / K-hell) TaxID=771870 RepID=F7W3V6_SORMK|nr:uncharacterized protein SMAC_05486 [Sordaria macrospora k-hell]CCC12309.1 unnamed protein product [Sordaria macrospora k-hell]